MTSDLTLAGSKCPVDHHDNRDTAPAKCPVDHTSSQEASKDGSNSSRPQRQHPAVDPHNRMPATPEQQAANGQQGALSTARTVSTIPRAERYQSAGDSVCPALHDDDGSGKEKQGTGTEAHKKDMWIYPSEQMFFNAMKRKSWDPQERDMRYVVPIHNAVNEKCWNQILEWEQMHSATCGAPKLLKFEGRAHDLTPRARFFSLFGYQKPFDRHDWTVDRCGKNVRYVIDFYEGKRDPRNPQAPSFYLDVRPALTIESCWDRMRRFVGA
ncbi:Cytochrome c1 heme lyase [Coemansia sp. RSA 1939]|nr:Cytochrome c1 heme lyase [Coemansia sp. RSA 1939]KAJ2607103.1 Cytochrome c1 heme lyase [Coemansia sp. RSA 1804]KAJ2690183.1 Cytochrome c1 heme lyase [Coemansia sp. RSA 1285]